ncbi:MAG: hypothetical protein PHC88_05675 [Terrimicrobiaceae bacterium]|nr:hypothetical protein [Terrimicrobiaceae bacterium]
MNEFGLMTSTPPFKVKRLSRAAILWDRSIVGEGKRFRMRDGAVYAQHPSGAFVRTSKDRLSVKDRKAARRHLRASGAKD